MQNGYAIKVISGNKELIINCAPNKTLLEVMRENGLNIASDCGGNRLCGKCRVKITKGAPEPTIQDVLTHDDIQAGFRLACLVKAENNMTVEIPAEAQAVIATHGIGNSPADKPEEIQPLVQKYTLKLPVRGIEDQQAYIELIADALKIDEIKPEADMLKQLPQVLSDNVCECTATVFKNKLLAVEKGDTSDHNYGVAIDIGTTTVVCYLVNMVYGTVMDTEAQMNKQRAYGADVISRIDYADKNADGLELLHTLIIGQLNDMIRTLYVRNGIKEQSIYCASIAGNTTMIHLFLGLQVSAIAVAPFKPVTVKAMDLDSHDTGLKINGVVSILPGCSAFVGADITAGIIACNMAERIDSEKYALLLDLGTNGEIALCGGGHILSCAVAAGPAFEGGNISCGMSGTAGAVNAVCLKNDPVYTTVYGQKARGICGSGVLDTVSELLRLDLIDETGLMSLPDGVSEELASRLRGEPGKSVFTLEQNGADGIPVNLSQKDIRQIQLAKAAFSAGIDILLKAADIKNAAEAVETVYIAGGFGSYMNIDSALRIGLIPPELKGKTVSAGNAAGAGAVKYLVSRAARGHAAAVSEYMQYIELSGMPEFQDAYIEAMMFYER